MNEPHGKPSGEHRGSARAARAVPCAPRGTSGVSLCSDRLGSPGVFRAGAEHSTRGACAPQRHTILFFPPRDGHEILSFLRAPRVVRRLLLWKRRHERSVHVSGRAGILRRTRRTSIDAPIALVVRVHSAGCGIRRAGYPPCPGTPKNETGFPAKGSPSRKCAG